MTLTYLHVVSHDVAQQHHPVPVRYALEVHDSARIDDSVEDVGHQPPNVRLGTKRPLRRVMLLPKQPAPHLLEGIDPRDNAGHLTPPSS